MRITKKLMSLLLCVAIFLPLIGCNTNHDENNTTKDAPICKNADDVIAYLAELGPEVGLENALSELKLQSEVTVDGDTYYRLQQCYNGIPVYGYGVVYTTDNQGKQIALIGNSKDLNAVHPSEYIQDRELLEIVARHCFSDEDIKSESKELSELAYNLCFMAVDDDESLQLVYVCQIGTAEIVIDAVSGDILFSEETISEESAISYVVSDRKQENGIIVNKNGQGEYELANVEQGLYLVDLEGADRDADGFQLGDYNCPTSPDNIWGNSDAESSFENGALILSSISKLTDLFQTELGFRAPTGVILIGYNDGTGSGTNASGGTWGRDSGLLYVGTRTKYDNIDVLGHEYGHIMSHLIAGFGGARKGIEHQALDEGIADIFGELSEAWYNGKDAPDWLLTATAPIYNRDIKNPWNTFNATSADQKYSTSKDLGIHGEKYFYSTVISHSAYLMWNGIDGQASKKISRDQLLRLWYRALLMMPSDCDFSTCRTCVELAARSMDFTTDQLSCVSEAFDKVGIYAQSTDFDYVVGPGSTLLVLDKDGQPYANFACHITGNLSKRTELEDRSFSQSYLDNSADPLPLPSYEGAYTIRLYDKTDAPQPITVTIKIDPQSEAQVIKIVTNYSLENSTNDDGDTSPTISGAVSYQMQHEFYEYMAGDDKLCYKTQLDYPIFAGSSMVETQLNQRYGDVVAEYTYGDWDGDTWLASNEPAMGLPWYQNFSSEVVYNQGDYLSVKETSSFYLGGAHDYYYISGHTYNLNTGEELDIHSFIAATDSEIRQYADQHGAQGCYYESFYITEEGVSLLYRGGDATPYCEVLIPYTDEDSCVVSLSASSAIAPNWNSNAEVAQFAKAAGTHLNNWFYYCAYIEDTASFEENGGWEKGGSTFFKVNYPGVSSVSDLKALTSEFFTEQVSNQLLSENASQWKEQGGSLYWATIGGVGDHLVSKIGIVVQKESNSKYHIVFLQIGDGAISSSIPYASEANLVLENGRWVFDAEIPEPDFDTEYVVMTEREAESLLLQNADSNANADYYSKPVRTIRYQSNLWICGDDVRYIQAALIEMNYDGVAMTGVYDSGTAAAVGRFQGNHDMTTSKIVDSATADALEYYLGVWREKHALASKIAGTWSIADWQEYRFYADGRYEIYSVDAFEGKYYLQEKGTISVASTDTAYLNSETGSQTKITLSSDGRSIIVYAAYEEYTLTRRS